MMGLPAHSLVEEVEEDEDEDGSGHGSDEESPKKKKKEKKVKTDIQSMIKTFLSQIKFNLKPA